MISTWNPPKSFSSQSGISAGLSVDLEAAWALASGVELAVILQAYLGFCCWGHRKDFMVGCPLAAAVLSCRAQPDR